MKILLALLIVVEVLLILTPFQHCEIRRKGVIQAWSGWKRNPSSQTEKVWRDEKARLSRDRANLDGALMILIGVNTYGIVKVTKRIFVRRRHHHESGKVSRGKQSNP